MEQIESDWVHCAELNMAMTTNTGAGGGIRRWTLALWLAWWASTTGTTSDDSTMPQPTPPYTMPSISPLWRGYQLPSLAIFPGLAIAMSVLGFNLLGDGLRDLLDPRLKVLRVG